MELAGRTFADLRARGTQIEIRDLLIASIALQKGYSLLTRNREHFTGIRGTASGGVEKDLRRYAN